MTFNDLGIAAPILKALQAEGYEKPTPIQEQAIPILLDGKDLLGCAQTGTGKTAAFAIPILQQLYENPPQRSRRRPIRALIVSPTRELALQIARSIHTYSVNLPLKSIAIFGGVKQRGQTDALRRGVDVLVATPGRLLDLIGQGFINLGNIEHYVLDEADQMLDMGFIHDIRKISSMLPEDRQTLFFSATLPPDILKLAHNILENPERITIKPDQTTAERVEQAVYFVRKNRKFKLLLHLMEEEEMPSVLIFSRTRHGANRIATQLSRKGVPADAIHSDKSQLARQRALKNFQQGRLKALVATDIAARGIDVSKLSHVINYDLPNMPETYVHRIGRTGRAGESGEAWSFCAMDERPYLKDIERLIRQRIPVIDGHPFENTPEENEEDAVLLPKSKRKPPRRSASKRPGKPKAKGGAKPKKRNQRKAGGPKNSSKPGAQTGGSQHRKKRRPRPKKKASGKG